MSCDITLTELSELMTNSSLKQYKASTDGTISKTVKICASLLQLDYTIAEIPNYNGDLSTNYPSHILVPESEKPRSGSSPAVIYEQQTFDAVKFRDLIKSARLARCRARFPIPVIFYRGKYVCRSATLSGGAEIYTRSGFDYFYGSSNGGKVNDEIDDDEAIEVVEGFGADSAAREIKSKLIDWVYIDHVRQQDKKLIKYMNVGTIVDFMVENKKVKYGFNVTSSEKIDKEKRYAEFNIICLPYPGCEFFKLYKENGYNGENLKFNWQQNYVDAKIYVPEDVQAPSLNIDWTEYENWDIIRMTQNYVKLLLKYLRENSNGMLVHCISGWDRTPLFISLLRILLWADGAVHQSLNAHQMLYFTLAYDWYLFGHNLPDRLSKGEEILFFCFYVLKFFHSDEYCTTYNRRITKNSVSSSSSSSVCVLRTDSGGDVENMFSEVESTGSNLSLNSMESGRSHNDSTSHSEVFIECNNGNQSFLISQDSNGSLSGVEVQNGNSNSNSTSCLARTSPVSVPINARNRPRNESFSSINGSWHVISATGSLRSPEPQSALLNGFKRSTNTNSQESSTTTVCDDADSISSVHETLQTRHERLHDIREVFYKTYFATVGVVERDESIGALFNNFVGRVGLVPKTQ
ncbi:myotubularin-related protein 14 isoform X2 [Bradysia coprophila]|uniref:myotubularin-related protein 14 isoform X2 n=1 Tax=Bradysia coprophila TaxID=38358 RepID=UPI00187D7100|nr:myotubularin-related protein 14 isoform X2 [Bradysia coprophila]